MGIIVAVFCVLAFIGALILTGLEGCFKLVSRPVSDIHLEQKLKMKYFDQVSDILDNEKTKGHDNITIYLTGLHVANNCAPYDSIVRPLPKSDYKYWTYNISVKDKIPTCDYFFRRLYDVVRTYSWIKHYPDRPISESNDVQLSEEETAAAHKFFLDNLTDYMYTRYWLEEFDRDGMEIHHVISPDVYDQMMKEDPWFEDYRDTDYLGVNFEDFPKDYATTGEYSDEAVIEHTNAFYYITVNEKGYYAKSTAPHFYKNFFPIMPELKLFADCPILPQNPPEDLLANKRTILQIMGDYTAIMRDHAGGRAVAMKLEDGSEPPAWMSTVGISSIPNDLVKVTEKLTEIELKRKDISLSPNGVNNYGWQENKVCGYEKKTEAEWDDLPLRSWDSRTDWLSLYKCYPSYHEKTNMITKKEIEKMLWFKSKEIARLKNIDWCSLRFPTRYGAENAWGRQYSD